MGSGAKYKKNKNRVVASSPSGFSGNQFNVGQSNHGRHSHAGMVLLTNIKLISTEPYRRGCHCPILVDFTHFLDRTCLPF